MASDGISGADHVEAARVVLLLAATVAFIASLPAAASLPMAVRVSEVTMIVAAVVVCGTTRRHAVVALVLGIPAVVLPWLTDRNTFSVLSAVASVLECALLLYVLILMLGRVFRSRRVSWVTVGLAVNSYLLMAVAWSIAYIVVELVEPGSFSSFPDGVHEPGWRQELVYFSVVTMTTLGYGDISPVAPIARSLAMLEAVTGTMFLGVVIAGLLNRTPGSSS